MSQAPLAGILTFLFTDLESSTPLWEKHPILMQEVSARHDELLRDAFQANGGRVIKTMGDGFHVVFETPSAGIAAALAGQQAIATETWPQEIGRLKVRMGLHSGESQARDGDYYGTELNRAARVMGIGYGGQVLISAAGAALLGSTLPEGAALIDLGRQRLKGLSKPERVYQLAHPSLEQDFPALKSLVSTPHNLPAQLTSFVGRRRELAEVKHLLDSSRLLTLQGPGGTGKTRLMLQVAGNLLEEFPDGVWLVELAPISDPELVAQKVAGVLGVRERPDRPLSESLAMFLRRKEILLILDNVEHLIQKSAELAEYLLQACPQLKILVTGRESLSIGGETRFQVPSLSLPARDVTTAADLESFEAAQLFVDRARSVRKDFELSLQNTPAVGQICTRLDGIPLAIELAASRIQLLSPEQIAARLDDRFRLLTSASRTAVPRQQTLRATIDWSYALLSEPEQVLFKRLAAFVGGWTLDAAEAVCSGGIIEGFEVLELLTSLANQSLVVAEDAVAGVRYRRSETIRQYSREKFVETDEAETVRNRHLAYYCRLSEEAEDQLQRGEPDQWNHRLAAEQDNLRAALARGLARHPDLALRIVGAMRFFWNAGGYFTEGLRWTQQALERVETITGPEDEIGRGHRAAKAKALAGLAWAYSSLGENEAARIVMEQSIMIYRQNTPVDKNGLAIALGLSGRVADLLGLREEAHANLKESIALAREANKPFPEVYALSWLVQLLALRDGDFEGAQRHAENALRLARAAGLTYLSTFITHQLGLIAARKKDDTEARRLFELVLTDFQKKGAFFNATIAKSDLAHLERQLGNYTRALELYRETILEFQDFGQYGAVAHQLECFALVAIALNELDRALYLFGAAEAWREQAGTPMTPDEQIEYQQQVEIVRDRTASELFTKTWAAGRALTMEEAVQFATQADSAR